MSTPLLASLTELLLARCDPSSGALLDGLRPQIDDPMLEVIAAADYGQHVREHPAALRSIRDEGVVFTPVWAVPAHEVLALIR